MILLLLLLGIFLMLNSSSLRMLHENMKECNIYSITVKVNKPTLT